MKLVDMKCPSCGGIIDQNFTGNMVACEYCGSRYFLEDVEADAFQDDAAYDDYDVDSSLPMAE